MPTGDLIERAVGNALAAAVERVAATSGPRAYSVEQVANLLGVSRRTVYRLISDGKLPAVPHLTPLRIAASTLDDFLRAPTA